MRIKPEANFRNWPTLRLLALTVAATTSLAFFIKVAEEVVEGDAHAIDRWLILQLRDAQDSTNPLGPIWFEDFVRDITALGSPAVLGLFVLISVFFLFLAGQKRLSAFVLAATVGGTFIVTILKRGFDRPRPDLSPEGIYVYTASFPSGHAMVSAVVYLTLGALIARVVPGTKLKLYVIAVAFFLSGLVGCSRVYLGVHWPSDVLAGWAAGAAWALGGGVIAHFFLSGHKKIQ